MSTVTIVLLVILVILIAAVIALYFFGKKAQKKQDEQQAQIQANKQTVSRRAGWFLRLWHALWRLRAGAGSP